MIDIKVLEQVIAVLEKKVNFRCLKKPEMEDCKGCDEESYCDRESITFDCDGSLQKYKETLDELNIDNKDDYIEYSENHGGYCDCEVIFNVKEYLN